MSKACPLPSADVFGADVPVLPTPFDVLPELATNPSAHDHYMFSSVYQNKTFKHITDSTVKNYSPTYRAAMRNTTDRDDYVMVGADGLVANSSSDSCLTHLSKLIIIPNCK